MRKELQKVIANFRWDQELALAYLHGRLGLPVPSSAVEWAFVGRAQIASVASTVEHDGVQLRKHGYGIEVIHPEFRIDFDYGLNGECDCFDGWRLGLEVNGGKWVYSSVNCAVSFRISLPLGVKERFEELSGFTLSDPPQVMF